MLGTKPKTELFALPQKQPMLLTAELPLLAPKHLLIEAGNFEMGKQTLTLGRQMDKQAGSLPIVVTIQEL